MTSSKPTISIRRLGESDWSIFKELRLEALKNEPTVFCPSNNEFEYKDEVWREALAKETKIVFGLFESEAIGLSGIVSDRRDPTGRTGLLVMSYIRPEFRGQGLSKLFYEARISWAKEQAHFKRLLVGHRAGNEASRKANQHFGFKLLSRVKNKWPDGSIEDLLEYELKLN